MKSVLALVLLGFSFAANAEDLQRNPFPQWSGKYDVYGAECSYFGVNGSYKKTKCQATTLEVRTKGENVTITESGKGWKKESNFTQYWKDGTNHSFFIVSRNDDQFNPAGYSESVRPSKNEIRDRSFSMFYNKNNGEVWFTARERHYVNSSTESDQTVRFYKLKAQSIWPF